MIARAFFSRLPLVLVLLLPFAAIAADPRVRGALSADTVGVGEPVEYELTIEGEGSAANPPAPAVDGLELRNTGQSSQLSIINGNVTRRVTFTYTLVPQREGKFTIPELEVTVEGRQLKTQALTLTVTAGEKMKEAGDLAFGKVWLEKNKLFIGEVATLEIRLYLDASARWDLRGNPTLNGDGFSTQPLGKPGQRQVQLAGKTYHLVTFRTVITPGKAGNLTIGPVPVPLGVSKPDRNRSRFDIFGGAFASAQEMTVTAPALDVEVKPLPAEGRPKDFSGAIGKFEFSASGTPDRVKVGEPVAMKLLIKGSGNFDRITQPPLAEPDGWTSYSAKEEFEGAENGGTTGAKRFELPVTPTAKKTTMPVFAFSFFDPGTEKYVTLKSAATPLVVEGEPLTAPAAPIQGAQPTQEPPKPAPKETPPSDILANLPDLGPASAGFAPGATPLVFFSAMFAPLPVALAVMAWRRRRTGKAAKMALLRKERSALLARVKNSGDRGEVLDAAVRSLQIETALNEGRDGIDNDPSALLSAVDEGTDAGRALRELFEARNELLYAGASRNGGGMSEAERDRVLEAIALVRNTYRK